MPPRLKQVLKRWLWVHALYHILDNLRVRRRTRQGRHEHRHGSTHAGFSLEESLDYVERVFRDYLEYGRLQPRDLQGARVLEIGPGDSFGVALRFLAAGARQVVCWDRFWSERDPAQQAGICRALLARLSPEERSRVAGAVDLEGPGPVFKGGLLRYEYGRGIEDALDVLEQGSFNLIVSRAVLEHLYDPGRGLQAMDRLLVPGGRMAHKVDFRDHGLLTASGHHPLAFLRYSDRVWSWMTRDSGKPNRRLIDVYRAHLERLGHAFTLYKVGVVGREEELVPHPEKLEPGRHLTPEELENVRAIQPRLARRFRRMPLEDLVVSAVFLSSRKPDKPGEPPGSLAARRDPGPGTEGPPNPASHRGR